MIKIQSFGSHYFLALLGCQTLNHILHSYIALGWLTSGMTLQSSPRSWTACSMATTTDLDPGWEVSQPVHQFQLPIQLFLQSASQPVSRSLSPSQPVGKTKFPSVRLCPSHRVTHRDCASPSHQDLVTKL